MDLAILLVFIFLCASLCSALFASAARRVERSPFQRLMHLVADQAALLSGGAGARALATHTAAPDRLPFQRALETLAERFSPAEGRRRLHRRLEVAGVADRLTPAGFFVLRVLASAGGLGIGLFVFLLMDPASPWRGPAAGLIALALAAGPDLRLHDQIQARQKMIRQAMPDTLDLMVVSVEAGLAFDAAVARVTAKTEGPLADELRKMLRDTQLGMTRGEALRAMAARCQVREVSAFAAAICQAEQLGGSIASALRAQSRVLRVKHSQRLREQAAKLPIKMLFPLVFFIFPAIFIVLLGPGIMKIVDAFSGG